MSEPKVFTDPYDEPDVRPGTIAIVNYGDYRYQEVWVADGSNIGNWYPRGWIERSSASPPQHPVWADVVRRGPVVLMVPAGDTGYRQGWADGRANLVHRMDDIRYDGPGD